MLDADEELPAESVDTLRQCIARRSQAALWLAGGQIALAQAEFLEFASDWTGEAVKLWPDEPRIAAQRAEALLLRGDTAAALPCWRQANAGEQPDIFVAIPT